MNRIFEEIGKSFGRQIGEMVVAQGLSTFVNGAISAAIELVKTKKMIEMQQRYGIDSSEYFDNRHENFVEGPYEDQEEVEELPEPEPEPKPKKKRKKDK